MAKPVINSIICFDATRGSQISFTLSGDVSYGNRITVYDATTNNLVYAYPKDKVKAEKSPVRLTCNIPANVLTNGKRYYAQVEVANASGTVTGTSNKMAFYCLTTPTLEFVNVENGKVIASSYYDAVASYNQLEGEKLQSYRFGLYDRNKVLITESTLLYDSSEMKYRFKNLATNAVYYFRVTGVTVRGMSCDSGLIEVSAQYTVKQDYAQLVLENYPMRGYISYSTNIKLIGFLLDNSDYLFVNSGYLGSIDLTGRNPMYKDRLMYEDGFLIEKDWTMWLRGYGFNPNTSILTYSNDNGQYIKISCHRYDDTFRFKLTCSDGVTKYIRYTKPVKYSLYQFYTLFVRRHGDLFEFYIYDNNTSETGDYTMYQADGKLYVQSSGRMPYYTIIGKDLYTTEDNVYLDSATGQLYARVN